MTIPHIRHYTLILVLSIFSTAVAQTQPVPYQATLPKCQYDSLLRDIKLPLIEIWTVDGKEPQGYHVYAPADYCGVALRGNEYVEGRMRITLNNETTYDSEEYVPDKSGMRIKWRGNSSSIGEKKPYKIKLSKKADLLFRDDNKYKDKDWILLKVYDGYFIRLLAGNQLGRIIGLEWEPEWEYVNVVINGDYKGDYILIESVEREKGRLYVDKSGYIIEDDAYWWNEETFFRGNMLMHKVGYTFKYPETEEVTDSIITNIKNDILAFEETLINNGDIGHWIDINSFAAWLLAQDILGQGDSFGSNRIIYKEGNNLQQPGSCKLKMGPLWDYDGVFKNDKKWSDIHQTGGYSFYFQELLGNKDFYYTYTSLWHEIKKGLHKTLLEYFTTIGEEKGSDINKSRTINQMRWPQDNSTPLSQDISDADNWFKERIAWINLQVPSDETNIDNITTTSSNSFNVYTMEGQLVKDKACMEYIQNLPKGMYLIQKGDNLYQKIYIQ